MNDQDVGALIEAATLCHIARHSPVWYIGGVGDKDEIHSNSKINIRSRMLLLALRGRHSYPNTRGARRHNRQAKGRPWDWRGRRHGLQASLRMPR